MVGVVFISLHVSLNFTDPIVVDTCEYFEKIRSVTGYEKEKKEIQLTLIKNNDSI